ncbi:MAG: hypothetical protein RLZZ299_3170 [Pseudomonadota bacterium]|jgi:hypothetical protein
MGDPVAQLGRMMVLGGLGLAVLGGVLWAGARFGLGRLPGDLAWGGDGWSVRFPLATSLLVSVVLTILLHLWARARG